MAAPNRRRPPLSDNAVFRPRRDSSWVGPDATIDWSRMRVDERQNNRVGRTTERVCGLQHCLAVAVAFSLSVSSIGCFREPPLRVTELGDRVVVDMQTLGEYQTTIKRIRVVDNASNQTIWELRASSGEPQVNRIELSVGVNPALPPGVVAGSYAVTSPSNASSFLMTAGRQYKITVWGSDGESSKATRTFRLSRQR